MKKANLFENIPTQLQEELFEEILSSKNVTIERIISKGHSSPKSGWYDQKSNEWVMVLQGEAIIAFENEEVHLNAGDYCNIPAHTKHKVTWTLPECETVWLAVHY
ncbi:cupin domain-containing protein [bacterium]|nr:cupin domain-containing protein [bacterium]MBU1433369.1 cupin domain-containing protein [bacterium]MBU1503435.1 cupin domain-containing protein [bacterium]